MKDYLSVPVGLLFIYLLLKRRLTERGGDSASLDSCGAIKPTEERSCGRVETPQSPLDGSCGFGGGGEKGVLGERGVTRGQFVDGR